MNSDKQEVKLYFLNNNVVSLHIKNQKVDSPHLLSNLSHKDNVEEFLTALSLLKDMTYVSNNNESNAVLDALTSDSLIKKLYNVPTDIISMQSLPFNPTRNYGGCFFSTEQRGSVGYICGDMSVIEKFCKETHDMEEAVRIANKWSTAGFKVTAYALREEIDAERNFIIRGNMKKMHFIGLFGVRDH